MSLWKMKRPGETFVLEFIAEFIAELMA